MKADEKHSVFQAVHSLYMSKDLATVQIVSSDAIFEPHTDFSEYINRLSGVFSYDEEPSAKPLGKKQAAAKALAQRSRVTPLIHATAHCVLVRETEAVRELLAALHSEAAKFASAAAAEKKSRQKLVFKHGARAETKRIKRLATMLRCYTVYAKGAPLDDYLDAKNKGRVYAGDVGETATKLLHDIGAAVYQVICLLEIARREVKAPKGADAVKAVWSKYQWEDKSGIPAMQKVFKESPNAAGVPQTACKYLAESGVLTTLAKNFHRCLLAVIGGPKAEAAVHEFLTVTFEFEEAAAETAEADEEEEAEEETPPDVSQKTSKKKPAPPPANKPAPKKAPAPPASSQPEQEEEELSGTTAEKLDKLYSAIRKLKEASRDPLISNMGLEPEDDDAIQPVRPKTTEDVAAAAALVRRKIGREAENAANAKKSKDAAMAASTSQKSKSKKRAAPSSPVVEVYSQFPDSQPPESQSQPPPESQSQPPSKKAKRKAAGGPAAEPTEEVEDGFRHRKTPEKKPAEKKTPEKKRLSDRQPGAKKLKFDSTPAEESGEEGSSVAPSLSAPNENLGDDENESYGDVARLTKEARAREAPRKPKKAKKEEETEERKPGERRKSHKWAHYDGDVRQGLARKGWGQWVKVLKDPECTFPDDVTGAMLKNYCERMVAKGRMNPEDYPIPNPMEMETRGRKRKDENVEV